MILLLLRARLPLFIARPCTLVGTLHVLVTFGLVVERLMRCTKSTQGMAQMTTETSRVAEEK